MDLCFTRTSLMLSCVATLRRNSTQHSHRAGQSDRLLLFCIACVRLPTPVDSVRWDAVRHCSGAAKLVSDWRFNKPVALSCARSTSLCHFSFFSCMKLNGLVGRHLQLVIHRSSNPSPQQASRKLTGLVSSTATCMPNHQSSVRGSLRSTSRPHQPGSEPAPLPLSDFSEGERNGERRNQADNAFLETYFLMSFLKKTVSADDHKNSSMQRYRRGGSERESDILDGSFDLDRILRPHLSQILLLSGS